MPVPKVSVLERVDFISTRGKERGVSETPDTKYVRLMRDEDQYHCTSDSSFCEEDTQIILL